MWAKIPSHCPDGRRILLAAGDTAQVYDGLTGQLISPAVRHAAAIWAAALSPDGNRFLTRQPFTGRDSPRFGREEMRGRGETVGGDCGGRIGHRPQPRPSPTSAWRPSWLRPAAT
jgi:hypothetical protein